MVSLVASVDWTRTCAHCTTEQASLISLRSGDVYTQLHSSDSLLCLRAQSESTPTPLQHRYVMIGQINMKTALSCQNTWIQRRNKRHIHSADKTLTLSRKEPQEDVPKDLISVRLSRCVTHGVTSSRQKSGLVLAEPEEPMNPEPAEPQEPVMSCDELE